MNLHALLDYYKKSEEAMNILQIPYRRMGSSAHHLQWLQTHRWPLSGPYQRGQNIGEEEKAHVQTRGGSPTHFLRLRASQSRM